jgi:hypothetical protein
MHQLLFLSSGNVQNTFHNFHMLVQACTENPGQNFCKLFLKIYFGKNRASPGISTYPNVSQESLEMIPDTPIWNLSAAVVVVNDNDI